MFVKKSLVVFLGVGLCFLGVNAQETEGQTPFIVDNGFVDITPLKAPTYVNYGLLNYSLKKQVLPDKNFSSVGEVLIFRGRKGEVVKRLETPLKQLDLMCLNDREKTVCEISQRILPVAGFQYMCTIEVELYGGKEPLISTLTLGYGHCRERRESKKDFDLYLESSLGVSEIPRTEFKYKRASLLEFRGAVTKEGSGDMEGDLWVSAIAVDGRQRPIWSGHFMMLGNLDRDRFTFSQLLRPSIWKRSCGIVFSVDYVGILREQNLANNDRFIEFGDCLDEDERQKVDLAGLLQRKDDRIEINIFNLGRRDLFASFVYRLKTFDSNGREVYKQLFSRPEPLEGFGEYFSKDFRFIEGECAFELIIDPDWHIPDQDRDNNIYRINFCTE